MKLPADDPRAIGLAEAIRAGDVEALERLLAEHEELATARIVNPACGDERTALHVLTDWPGNVRNGGPGSSARLTPVALTDPGASIAFTHTVREDGCMSEIVNVRFDPDSGYWIVKRDGGARASSREDTQDQGRAVGRRLLSRAGGELRVWNKAGNDFTSHTVVRR